MDIDDDDEEEDHHHHTQNQNSPPDFFSSTARFQQSFASRPPILFSNATGNGSLPISFATVADQINVVTNGKNGGAVRRGAGGRNNFGREKTEEKKKRNFFAGGSPLPVFSGEESW